MDGLAVEWLKGLAGFVRMFVEVVPNGKSPSRCFDHFKQQVAQVGVSSALAWLERGSNVGIVPKFPLWVLDADSAYQVNRIVDKLVDLGIDPLMVATRRGGHFYFQLPADFPTENLKTYLPAGDDKHGVKIDLDFKLPGTLLVAPGSVRDEMTYKPASSWRMPPVLDPMEILPDGKFWKEPQRPFLVNTRPLKDRLAAARIYLQRDAPVSIYLKHGARTLAGVASYLVVFLGLDPATAASLLVQGKKPWNSRCAYKDGKPYPWTRDELWDACNNAVGTVPWAGVKAYERRQAHLEQKTKLAGLVAILKSSLTSPPTEKVPVAKVVDTFDWLGLPDLTKTALGDELKAQGVARVKATGKRTMHIPGLNFWAMLDTILEAKRRRGVHECPCMAVVESIQAIGSPCSPLEGSLIKQVRSLESQVSADQHDGAA